ncbi:MAG: hypothetical protein MZV63_29110 [Marinilabiliales bacterium]|nr:hypothetical protein [Marinilabiliales bacterium]
MLPEAARGKCFLHVLTDMDTRSGTLPLIAGFYLDITNLIDEGGGNFLAVGSASPDSADNGDTGILFVRFDTAGQIIKKTETTADENRFCCRQTMLQKMLREIFTCSYQKARQHETKGISCKV